MTINKYEKQMGGIVTMPVLSFDEHFGQCIPIRDNNIGNRDNPKIVINVNILPDGETYESLGAKILDALTEAKMRGATGEVV